MALRKIIETEGTAVIQTSMGSINNGIQRVTFSAYIKVIQINGNKSQVDANVSFKSDTQEFHRQYRVPVSVEANAPNFIAQVYAHLKTLPEFSGSIDC